MLEFINSPAFLLLIVSIGVGVWIKLLGNAWEKRDSKAVTDLSTQVLSLEHRVAELEKHGISSLDCNNHDRKLFAHDQRLSVMERAHEALTEEIKELVSNLRQDFKDLHKKIENWFIANKGP